jgi:glycosyltransferase involved in cell wall biosynthesis
VRVASRVGQAHPAAHFFVAGDGELRPEMEAEIRRLGIGGRFHLLGWRRDVRSLLGAADVIVLTSLWEGLPRAVLQAMAAGKPVVASRVDGTPEAVKDGDVGFLLEPHDIDGFAERLNRLITQPELAQEMGRRGRRRVDDFSVSTMLDKLVALYDGLLAQHA